MLLLKIDAKPNGLVNPHSTYFMMDPSHCIGTIVDFGLEGTDIKWNLICFEPLVKLIWDLLTHKEMPCETNSWWTNHFKIIISLV